ncbi:NADH:ubiquinone reductase (H(+)-translocating) [Ranunculus cassubicifolius]
MDIRRIKHKTPLSCLRIANECAKTQAKDQNFVFSPYSIQLALSLLTNGSTGSTKAELLTFLEEENLDDLNTKNGRLLDLLCKIAEGDPILSVVGGIWIDQSLTLKPTFKRNAEKFYKAKVDTVDFQDKAHAKEAVHKVNEWADEATNGLIKSVLPEGSFTPSTRVVLANALFFKGRWSEEFEIDATFDSKFFLLDGNSVEVPFMYSWCDRRRIATFDDFKILELPYGCDSFDYHMSILLPNKRDGLQPLMEMLSSDPLFMEKYIIPPISSVSVGDFRVPKFKITYGFDAIEVLKALGLQLPFSSRVKLDGIAEGLNSQVSKVIHKSYIDVNEEGTEAAGVTVKMDSEWCNSIPIRPIALVDFVADHPFMFMVRENLSGAVLFMGQVVNPCCTEGSAP